MVKTNHHNEWFRPVTKTTCSCGQKKTQVYSWGEYVCAKWRTIDYVCQNCFPIVSERLQQHKKECGCEFKLIGYRGCSLPDWLKMPVQSCQFSHQVTVEDV